MTALCLHAARDASALTFGPGVDFEVRQDQLPGAASGTEGWIARVSPRLSVARITQMSKLEMTGIRSFDSNERLKGPTWAGDEAGLRFDATPGRYTRFSTFGGYVSSRDPLGTHSAGPVTFNQSAIATGGARLELWRLEGAYQVRSHTYESSNAVDGLSHTWEATLFPMRRPDMQLVVSGRGRVVKIENERSMTTVDVTGGWRRTHFEGLSSEFEAGVAKTDDDRSVTDPYRRLWLRASTPTAARCDCPSICASASCATSRPPASPRSRCPRAAAGSPCATSRRWAPRAATSPIPRCRST
jgi:hypothetical protein